MKWITLLLGLAMTAGWGMAISWSRAWQGQNDFLAFYCGAKLAGTPELHSTQAMIRLQQEHAQIRMPGVLYIRPDYYALLLKPLSWLSYRKAYALFQLANLLALLSFLALFRERRLVLYMAAMSVPLVTSFMNGQDVPLLLLFLGLTYVLEKRGAPFAAGLCLALCTIKPHLFLFVPIALILWQKWRVLAGASAGVAALTAAAMTQQWDWLLRFPQYLRQPVVHPDAFQFMNLRGVTKAMGSDWHSLLPVLSIAAACAVCWILWVTRGRAAFGAALAVSIIGGLLVSYHLGVHDCSLLLAVIAFLPSRPILLNATAALAAPPAYYLLMLDNWMAVIPALSIIALFALCVWQLHREPAAA